ncbi:MAG: hypothetical protein WCL23_02880 [Candidatus Moraniibacteriota bacterium]
MVAGLSEGTVYKNILKMMQTLSNKLKFSKEKLTYLLVFLVVFILTFFGNTLLPYINTVTIWLLGVLFVLISLFAWFLAGSVLMKSLVVVGGEIAVLSFLATSYCAVSGQYRDADDALKNILGFGALYVIGKFFASLYKELVGDKDAKDISKKNGIITILKDKDSKTMTIFMLSIYAAFLGLFLWQLYRVIHSIYVGLCIFR